MAGEAQSVDVHFFHVDGKDAGGLGGVRHKDQAMAGADLTYLLDRQHGAAQIGGVEHHHGPGVRANQVLHLLGVQHPVPVGLSGIKGHALMGHLHQRAHHAVVLHGADDHMISRLEQALDHIVEGVGDAGSEDHIAGF